MGSTQSTWVKDIIEDSVNDELSAAKCVRNPDDRNEAIYKIRKRWKVSKLWKTDGVALVLRSDANDYINEEHLTPHAHKLIQRLINQKHLTLQQTTKIISLQSDNIDFIPLE